MSKLNRAFAFTLLLGATTVSAQPAAGPAKMPSAEKTAAPASQPVAAKPAADAKKTTVHERLAATAKLYAEAKNYRDEGTLESVSSPEKTDGYTQRVTFNTALERGGRFRWEFEKGEKAKVGFVNWSADGKLYKGIAKSGERISPVVTRDKPLGLPAGLSCGLDEAVLPLLNVGGGSTDKRGTLTDLLVPQDQGEETIDGVNCRKITGTRNTGTPPLVTLWIDGRGLIRKVRIESVMEIVQTSGDPKVPGRTSKHTTVTTILLKPVVNEEKVDDGYFVSNQEDGSRSLQAK